MKKVIESPFLDAEEAADYLKINPKTLHNMRWRGGGPPFRKHGGKAVYHIESLKMWSARREMGAAQNSGRQDNKSGSGRA